MPWNALTFPKQKENIKNITTQTCYLKLETSLQCVDFFISRRISTENKKIR